MDPRRVLRWRPRSFDHDRDPGGHDVAMTGEITFKGTGAADRGLKEKLLACARGGIKTVLIPEDNAKDLTEIPMRSRAAWTSFRSHADDVISKALVRHRCRLSGKRIPRCRLSRTLPGTKQRVA